MIAPAVTAAPTAVVDLVAWADLAEAIGTLAGVALAVAVLLTAVRARTRDFHAATRALVDQQQLLREQAARQFRLDLLLRVRAEIHAFYTAEINSPERVRARTALIGLLDAVGDDDDLPLTRLEFADGDIGRRARWESAAQRDPHNRLPPTQRQVLGEVAAAMRTTARPADRTLQGSGS